MTMEEPYDQASWQDWFEIHGPKLLLCARQWTRSLADAEDVVQEAFVRYWRLQRNLPGDPKALLLTSIRRAAIDRGRRETRRLLREAKAGDEWEINAGCFEPPLASDGRHDELETALARLPVEQREVLTLKIWNELTFEQIGAILEISPNTAASRYRYALAALRSQLNPLCHG
jgi:RNA polymerase sigma-70 factor (ECF subfamily)